MCGAMVGLLKTWVMVDDADDATEHEARVSAVKICDAHSFHLLLEATRADTEAATDVQKVMYYIQ